MSQQINLYSPIFRREKKYFSARTMAVSLGVVIAGVAALSVYARMQVGALETQARQTTAQLKSAIEQLQTATADKSGEERRKALETKIQSAETQLKATLDMAAALESGSGDTQGFSEHLRALARQTVPGVWLTGISIESGAGVVSMNGAALRAELVPDYIERLGREESFRGLAFGRVEIGVPSGAAAATSASATGNPGAAEAARQVAFRFHTAAAPSEPAEPAAQQ